MSRLLVVQPDSVQADVLRDALCAHTSEEVVVAESIDAALSLIDEGVPDVVLLPTLSPAAVEGYLLTYLGTLPGAGHVQILGLPHLERSDDSLPRRLRSLFRWRPEDQPGTRNCDPELFVQDVITYLAGARALKEQTRTFSAHLSSGLERRREPRFEPHEVPWISFVRFGSERAVLMNVSTRGALLRIGARPEHHVLLRSDPTVHRRPRLMLELGSIRPIGRVIRCVPLRAGAQTQYEIAFSFDDAVGLHLPQGGTTR